MKILTFGDIIDCGSSVFNAVAQLDREHLLLKFRGVIRIDHPYKHLSYSIEDMDKKLPDQKITSIELDFTELKYCNSNGFYILMDIIETVYNKINASVVVKRLKDDDWHRDILPILLNIEDEEIGKRTYFEDTDEI